MLQVVTKTNTQHFAGNSEDDMWQWVQALQSVAFKDTVSRQTIEEDNELYCSAQDGNSAIYIYFNDILCR